jgi:hypothetical protein
MIKISPLVLLALLAGCATAGGPLDAEVEVGSQPIVVQVFQTDQNAYELVPSYPGLIWGLITPSKDEASEAIKSRAASLCAPGAVEVLDEGRPDYIGVELSARAYLHCR